jgi:hypothetical protein
VSEENVEHLSEDVLVSQSNPQSKGSSFRDGMAKCSYKDSLLKKEIQVHIGQGGGQPNPKKAKPNDQEPSQSHDQLQLECLGKDRPVDAKMKATMGENTVSNMGSCSTPTKVDWEKGVEKPKKLMSDAQKSFQKINVLSSEELKILYNGGDRVQGLSGTDIQVSEEEEEHLLEDVQGS